MSETTVTRSPADNDPLCLTSEEAKAAFSVGHARIYCVSQTRALSTGSLDLAERFFVGRDVFPNEISALRAENARLREALRLLYAKANDLCALPLSLHDMIDAALFPNDQKLGNRTEQDQ